MQRPNTSTHTSYFHTHKKAHKHKFKKWKCKTSRRNVSLLFIYSVQFSWSVDQACPTLQPHGLQHTRLPCPSPTPGASSLMPIEAVMPFNRLILCRALLLLPSVFPNIRVFSIESVFYIRWPKHWNFSFSISPSNDIQDWFPLGLTGWISLQSKGLLRVFSNTTVQKHQFFIAQLSL